MRGRRIAAVVPLFLIAANCVPPAEVASGAEAPPAPAPAPVIPAAPPPPPVPAELILGGRAEQGGVMIGKAPATTRALTLDGRAVPVAADGGFLIAFDRDAGPGAHLVATLADGRVLDRRIDVAPGTWRIEHINAPYRGSAKSDADFERRRPAELAQIRAARAVQAESGGWRQAFVWPVTGRFSGFFGSQRVYQGKPGSYHSGTDVAAAAGTPFVAPADGVVVLAAEAPFTLEGYLLIVDHGMGLTSAFLHCQRLDVTVGDRVVQGQRLGTVGATGRATGPHMHWGLTWQGAGQSAGQGARLDPGKLAGAMPQGAAR